MSRLRDEATGRISSALGALVAAFTLEDLNQMVEARDLSPLEEEVDRTYDKIGEIALLLFLLAFGPAVEAAHPHLVGDTSRWRIAESQAHVRGSLATALADDQKRVLREILASSRDVAGVVVAIRLLNALGLTSAQYRGIENYERVVSTPSRRDLEKGGSLTYRQIAVMTGAKAADYRQLRAAVLGLVESQRAQGRADLEAWTQAAEANLRDRARIGREWHVTGHNTRDSHWSLNGVVVGLDDAFVSGLGNRLMYPGDGSAPAQDVANCNCWVTYHLR